MGTPLDLFQQSLFLEAPGDEGEASTDAQPTDPPADDAPPDIPDDVGTESDNDAPPDMPDEDPSDDGLGDTGFDDGQQQEEEDPNKTMKLDAKVSTVMNVNLYQRYLTLLNTINTQLSMIKNNGDMIYTLSDQTSSIIASLKKLDENIRLYMSNIFLEENYSRNLLFFNKCLNLLKLLNDSFDASIQKGIKDKQ